MKTLVIVALIAMPLALILLPGHDPDELAFGDEGSTPTNIQVGFSVPNHHSACSPKTSALPHGPDFSADMTFDENKILELLNYFKEDTKSPLRWKYLVRIRALSSVHARVIPFLISCFRRSGLTSWNAFNALQRIGADAIPALIKAASNPDDKTRKYALLTLSRIKHLSKCHLPFICSIVTNEGETAPIRCNAISVLSRFSSDLPALRRMLPALKATASDTACDHLVRRSALRAMAILGREPEFIDSTLHLLISFVENPNEVESLSETALDALADLAKTPDLRHRILPTILGALRNTENHSYFRSDAAEAACEFFKMSGQDNGILSAIVDVLQSKEQDWFFLERLAECLSELGPLALPAVPGLLTILKNRRTCLAKRHLADAIDMELYGFDSNHDRPDVPFAIADAILHIAPHTSAYRVAVLHLELENMDSRRVSPRQGEEEEDDDPTTITHGQVKRTLIESLGMPDFAALALQVVGERGINCPEVFQGVLRACEDPAESIRAAAVRVLGNEGNQGNQVVRTIHDLLLDMSPMVREAACDAVYQIRDDFDSIDDNLEYPSLFQNRLKLLFETDTPRVRTAAAQVLSRWPEKDFSLGENKKELLCSKDSAVRLRLAAYLPVSDLLTLVEDPDPRVRRMALSRLLESDHDERQKRIIAACLTAHAKDPCIEIRMTVAESIADYNPKDALRVLITLLEDENLFVRECAVSSLKNLKTKAAAAVPTLLRTIPKAEGELREDMLRALGVIKSHPVLVVPFLTDILTHDSDLHRSEAAWALGEFGEDAEPAVRALLSLLKSKDGSARNAAQALGKIGKQPSLVIPALCAFLNRKGSVNLYLKSGIDALAVFGPDAKSALPIIHSILKTALSKSHTQYTVSAALCAIARIAPQDPKTLPLLLGFLKGHHEVIQEGALNGLAFMGSEAADALPVLKKLPKSYKVGNAIRAIEKAIR